MLNETVSVIFKHHASGLFHSWILVTFGKPPSWRKKDIPSWFFFSFFFIDHRFCRKEALCKLLRPNITVYENPIKCLIWIFHFHAFGNKSERFSFQTHFWRENSNCYIFRNETLTWIVNTVNRMLRQTVKKSVKTVEKQSIACPIILRQHSFL